MARVTTKQLQNEVEALRTKCDFLEQANARLRARSSNAARHVVSYTHRARACASLHAKNPGRKSFTVAEVTEELSNVPCE